MDERGGWQGRERAVDNNLTAIHQSANCVASGKNVAPHCTRRHAHKYSSEKLISVNIKNV